MCFHIVCDMRLQTHPLCCVYINVSKILSSCLLFILRYILSVKCKYWETISPVYYDWFHLLFVFHGNGISVYINGILENSNDIPTTYPSYNGPEILVIGRLCMNVDDWYASVCVDEIMMWNTHLSAEELTSLYQMYV